MKIQYKRTGGFANITKRVEVDSTELPFELHAVLESPVQLQPPNPLQSDEFFHELELEDGRTIRCTDSECSPALLKLFAYLASLR